MVGHAPVSRQRLPTRDPRLLGQILQDMGAISEADLTQALTLQRRYETRLGDIFLAEGMINTRQLRRALALQYGISNADLAETPPDPKMRDALDAKTCLKHAVVPWRRIGPFLVVATAHPERLQDLIDAHADDDVILLPAIADAEAVRRAIATLHGPELGLNAEQRVPPELSCRTWGKRPLQRRIGAAALVALALFAAGVAPVLLAQGLAIAALFTLILATAMKGAATFSQIRHETMRGAGARPAPVTPLRLPKVSVMVPLLHEREIAHALVQRLSRLTYPKALLDVVLVLEAHDTITRTTLRNTTLPAWMRVVEVPAGSGLTTKPRALNYALDFCQGSLIGIWDAEDSPAIDQIEQVVARFQAAPPDVICLQGQLDYYNPRQNWISRCFTIEYAAWWRLIMPGLARLGFVIPLGGTTLFFRRAPLETLGGWDAHNVTEDADLGLRLARAGYRTELIPTVTYEEANCRAWPWVRQRSRWLKGFAITWAVHMRNPLQLWRDLGTYKFLGLQVFYLSALSQFLLAPVLWSFWLLSFGVTLPYASMALAPGLLVLFLTCEAITLGIHALAVRREEHRHLIPWAPTMILYFPMGCIAMYKALLELISRPFFWDKTQHGVAQESSRRDSASC